MPDATENRGANLERPKNIDPHTKEAELPNPKRRTLPIRAAGSVADRNVADLSVVDLSQVVYSSGKVFDGLGTGRVETENFLRSGVLDGVTSRSDLALLEDLRDVSKYIIDNQGQLINNAYVRAVNSQITRSGPLHPGAYRTAEQKIGVTTPSTPTTQYGRHEPKPASDDSLQRIIDKAMALPGAREQSLELFVEIAKAQPFEDGNKRTALFVANSALIRQLEPELMVVPVDESSPDSALESAARFNDLLARAYVLDENDGIKDLLRAQGFEKART